MAYDLFVCCGVDIPSLLFGQRGRPGPDLCPTFPYLSSSKHRAVCIGNDYLDLIQLNMPSPLFGSARCKDQLEAEAAMVDKETASGKANRTPVQSTTTPERPKSPKRQTIPKGAKSQKNAKHIGPQSAPGSSPRAMAPCPGAGPGAPYTLPWAGCGRVALLAVGTLVILLLRLRMNTLVIDVDEKTNPANHIKVCSIVLLLHEYLCWGLGRFSPHSLSE